MDGPFRALREMDFDVKDLGISEVEVRQAWIKAVEHWESFESRAWKGCVLLSKFAARARRRQKHLPWGGGETEGPFHSFWNDPIYSSYEENIGPLTPMIADA